MLWLSEPASAHALLSCSPPLLVSVRGRPCEFGASAPARFNGSRPVNCVFFPYVRELVGVICVAIPTKEARPAAPVGDHQGNHANYVKVNGTLERRP